MTERIKELKYICCDSLDELQPSQREVVDVARRAAQSAIAPFSKFKVGAAARLASGELLCGANVESEVYPAGICAERNLLFNIATSHPNTSIVEFAITSISTEGECYPCGLCRQTLLDTERRQGSPIRIIMAGAESATIVESAELLLPFSFTL